ncbi:MAG TPA: SLBB domain-containing protein [Gemmatimonadales bacterium]
MSLNPMSPVRDWLIAGALSVACAAGAIAQNPPPTTKPPTQTGTIPQLPPGVTPEQAAQMVQQQPALGAMLRQRLLDSGLTPDQVRARLRAAGYPSNMLDQYMMSDSLGQATGTLTPPSTQVLDVVSALGLARMTVSDSLILRGDSVALKMYRDSLRADSITISDSLALITRKLDLFGLRQLRGATTQFQPIVTGPVDDAYRLGPGDDLVLILTGAVQSSATLSVGRDGFIVVPQVGQVFVNNLTLGNLRDVLYTRLGEVYSGVTRRPDAKTHFDITVSRVRAIQVRVAGGVARPGTYQVAATGSVFAALYAAGGMDEKGNFRRVEVRRGVTLVGTVDLYDYLLHGVVSNEIHLEAGDVVYVPDLGTRVKLGGEVTRPAVYELKPNEGLREAIALAGGLTPYAVLDAATIDHPIPPGERQNPGLNRTMLTADLRRVLDPQAPIFPLTPGDSVTIFSVRRETVRSSVNVKGNVWQPGKYRLVPGMRVWDAITTAGGIRPGTYNGRAQVLRLRPDSTKLMLGVALPDSGGVPQDNLLLQEQDEITVYARNDFRQKRFVSVYGSVGKPGLVAYSDSMTMRDAVLLAGGLKDDAALTEAEVSRIRVNAVGSADSLAVVVRVPLDSSFVFDPSARVQRPVGRRDNGVTYYLEPFDNIFVRRQPGYEVQRNVMLTGEVLYPGRYSLVAKDERLSHLLERAGGITRQAYPGGVRFFREESSAGRIGVDLPKVLRDPSYKDNLILMNADSIDIPPYIPTVRVEGEVNSPSSVTYVPNAGIGYYIDAAGGSSRFADKGGAYVQQPSGSIQRGKRPEPGAVVVVPKKDPNAKGIDIVALITGLASVAASLATSIVLLTR